MRGLPVVTSARLASALAAIALLLGSAALLVTTSPAGAGSFPGRNGKIAFARDTGTPAVWIMNADGSKPRMLVRSDADAPSPSWSADGLKLAFVGVKKGRTGIFVTDAHGKHTKQLTKNPRTDDAPSWSPDGSKIAFSRANGTNIDIWVMDANGKHPVDLTNTPDKDEDAPAWSPDGTTIAFTSQAKSTGISPIDVFVMKADGSGVHALTNGGATDHPNWSPDGTKIAFESTVDDQVGQIYVMNADGSNPVAVTKGPSFAAAPWWSPDGTKILFHTARHTSISDSQIYVVDADGSNEKALTDEDGVIDRHATWQPVKGD